MSGLSKASSPSPAPDARGLVDEVLDAAVRRRASDVHLEPTGQGLEVRYRIDGLLETVRTLDSAVGRSMVTRLMVLAHLLTYRLDVPQEGRATVMVPSAPRPLDLRLSVMPTTHGLRAAVRLPAELVQPRGLHELSLPADVLDGLHRFARADAGMLLVTGPAGSGKTTTIYALLDHIAQSQSGLSIVALEDPVERDLPGVTQIEVSPFGELTYERTLRSILRQDPQVLMLGEIRDAATATLAVQAALSGHRLVSTLHAATPAGAIARLLEMGIEPYQVSSALFGVVSQRLLRRRAEPGGGYAGRVPVAEFVRVDDALRRAILGRGDAAELARIYAQQPGFRPMAAAAGDCIRGGTSDEAEVRRVLGGEAAAVQ
jgi:type II secretory ATPase GspE/PulE/Tfp pilus assembly ATPase PilB-like protein